MTHLMTHDWSPVSHGGHGGELRRGELMGTRSQEINGGTVRCLDMGELGNMNIRVR